MIFHDPFYFRNHQSRKIIFSTFILGTVTERGDVQNNSLNLLVFYVINIFCALACTFYTLFYSETADPMDRRRPRFWIRVIDNILSLLCIRNTAFLGIEKFTVSKRRSAALELAHEQVSKFTALGRFYG